jgi:hypothetical protein
VSKNRTDATALNNSLETYEHCDQRGLNKIVTGDEMWIYFFLTRFDEGQ